MSDALILLTLVRPPSYPLYLQSLVNMPVQGRTRISSRFLRRSSANLAHSVMQRYRKRFPTHKDRRGLGGRSASAGPLNQS